MTAGIRLISKETEEPLKKKKNRKRELRSIKFALQSLLVSKGRDNFIAGLDSMDSRLVRMTVNKMVVKT